jgi:hypothetical protein
MILKSLWMKDNFDEEYFDKESDDGYEEKSDDEE